MNDNNSNFMLAILLSLFVLLGWQFFVIDPRLAEQAAQTHAPISETIGDGIVPRDAPQSHAHGTPMPMVHDKNFEQSPRLEIETAQFIGSIALMGARFDDLVLKDYAQTTAPDSPRQRLLQHANKKGHWQARHGWVGANTTNITLPDNNSLWTPIAGHRLTPQTPVTLEYTSPEGIIFTQHIAVDDDFMFTITQSVHNRSDQSVTLYPFAQISRSGQPDNQELFVLHEGMIGIFGDDGLTEISYNDIVEDSAYKTQANKGWLGMTDKYWATALIPPQDQVFTGRFTGRYDASGGHNQFRSDYLLAGIALAQDAKAEVTSRFFAGAKRVSVIDDYDADNINRFDLLIDWGWFHFLTKPMFQALTLFYTLTGNYGVAILLVTILIKLAFFPLANRSYETMAKMKRLQPEILRIREMHKDDRMAQQQALMKIYRDEKLNPLAGCLPVLLQIPVFFALYKVLYVTIDMRHQPFFGWISDLSMPDPTSLFNLFGLLPFDPPGFLLIGIWPLLMGVTMFVQMQMNPPPPDPIQARLFQFLPILFTFLLAGFPAGLVIYWAWNNFLSILQQGFIMRRHGVPIELFNNLRFTKRGHSSDKNDG